MTDTEYTITLTAKDRVPIDAALRAYRRTLTSEMQNLTRLIPDSPVPDTYAHLATTLNDVAGETLTLGVLFDTAVTIVAPLDDDEPATD